VDPRLLDYYNQELVALRELGREFAEVHPKIAAQLGPRAGGERDPYVERIVDSFCYLSARMRVKLDAEFPRFAARLLEVLYPDFTAPTPSMSVARFFPEVSDKRLTEGFSIARGTPLASRVAHGEQTACEFRTSQPVVLYPLEIASASLTDAPRELVSLESFAPQDALAQGALRLRLRTTGEATFADLRTLDRLPVYLVGEDHLASHLFELVHSNSVALLVIDPAEDARKVVGAAGPGAIAHDGLGPDQGLLPLTWSMFHGHNLLREYFACPARFHFFVLQELSAALSKVNGREAELVILLNRSPGSLASLVDVSRFALFCSPVVNLFRQQTDRIELSTGASEFHLVPRRRAPLDYEVFAVESVHGHLRDGVTTHTFRPMYQTLNEDGDNYGRYFSLTRDARVPSDRMRRHGSRTAYVGTEVYLSIVDQHAPPFSKDLRFLSAQAWVTNRDLPMLVPRDGIDDLLCGEEAPVASVGLVHAPSPPRPPFAGRESAWRLIRQLSSNFLPLEEIDHRDGGLAMRDLLRLYASGDDAVQQRQIESLVGLKTKRVSRKLAGKGPLVFANGMESVLTVDEGGFSGLSPYLFGLVLEQYMMRHAGINTFTQTELHSMQRGCVMRRPVHVGTRGAYR
jgi:type VI secretion system protein ImpG